MGEEHTKRNRKRKDRIRSTCAYCYTRASHSHILPFCRAAATLAPTTCIEEKEKGADVKVRIRRKNSPISFPFYPRRPPPLWKEREGKGPLISRSRLTLVSLAAGDLIWTKNVAEKRRRKNKFMAASASPQKGRKRKGRRPLSAVFAIELIFICLSCFPSSTAMR